MLLATMYAIVVILKVEPIQVIQCVGVGSVRCLEPRRMRMKMCLDGNCIWSGALDGYSIRD